jgi:hypothetical protein
MDATTTHSMTMFLYFRHPVPCPLIPAPPTFKKELYYDHIIHVNSEKEYEDFCKLLKSWKILKPSFIIDFGRG